MIENRISTNGVSDLETRRKLIEVDLALSNMGSLPTTFDTISDPEVRRALVNIAMAKRSGVRQATPSLNTIQDVEVRRILQSFLRRIK